ncbi:molybdopterin molybdotransferase MoeA [soil metagenome]
MISPEEALARILRHVQPRPNRSVSLLDAVGCFAGADQFASVSLPGFDNSAMDGYAVVAHSCQSGARLRVVGEQPAGLDRGLRVSAGEAVRILTGAPLPAGADAVIMQEDVRVEGEEIVITTGVEPGEFIRRCGIDVAAGQKILTRGEKITGQTAALLASQGLASIDVGGEVRVTVLSTGDELAPAGAELHPGQIYDSNSILLQALLRGGGATVAAAEHCADRAEEIEAAIRRGLTSDVLIITGGVSVGAHDLVKPALTAAGASLDLWRVAVKPGKPFLFGRAGSCFIFGLPGNPVSAFVTFLLFVRPALLQLKGAKAEALELREISATVAAEIHNPGDRPHYLRGLLRHGTFEPVGRQESHALFGLSRSNALLRLQPGERIPAGARPTVFLWE